MSTTSGMVLGPLEKVGLFYWVIGLIYIVHAHNYDVGFDFSGYINKTNSDLSKCKIKLEIRLKKIEYHACHVKFVDLHLPIIKRFFSEEYFILAEITLSTSANNYHMNYC